MMGMIGNKIYGFSQFLDNIRLELYFLFLKLGVEPSSVSDNVFGRQAVQSPDHHVKLAFIALTDIIPLGEQQLQFILHHIFHVILYFH